MATKKNLVIVESPAKAKTLSKILGKDYNIKASLGHIRDLPKSRLGVDVDNDFAPKYVVPRRKSKIVTELKKAAKAASTVYLATDPDREGEAISWHIAEVTKQNNIHYRRVVFHEITEEAIKQAFKHPRIIDMQLVNAQQARRIIDRLVGYKISPLLWKNVRRGLSAGRVQSIALKIIVDREREIEKFIPEEYWSIEAELAEEKAAENAAFHATLTGLVDGGKLEINNQQQATDFSLELKQASYSVLKVTTQKGTRQPPPPFITSTLQQEAWRRLHFTASHTMTLAQQLYEGLPLGKKGRVGLITYMRTDSTHMARSAIVETREFISDKYGAQFVPPHARSFVRSSKRAQEAHEAIRPTQTRREPSTLQPYLTNAQFKLYELIWQRTVASQMAAALFDYTTIDIKAKCRVVKDSYLLRASSSVNRFPGFMILTSGNKKDMTETEKAVSILPLLKKGQALKLLDISPEQHFTKAPSRFTEASLIKVLEQGGIGRPSTYAAILSTIQQRDYVAKDQGNFMPTELGFVVNDSLRKYFADIVNIEFTARMEDALDEVAHDNRDWVSIVRDLYNPLVKDLDQAFQLMEKNKLADEVTDEICSKCGKPMILKFGRYGKFIACSGFPECKNTKPFQIKIGVKCPDCDSELIERTNKKKRTFYGCSDYPKCTFATNRRPLPQPCPQCGGLLTQQTKGAKCTKCAYQGKQGDLKATVKAKTKAISSG
ncbi:type I DNA topoisomerase [Chloroflexota bacterium]